MANKPAKSTPSVEQMENIDSTLAFNNIGELKAWTEWATHEPRERIGEGFEGKYQFYCEKFWTEDEQYGIPLHFNTVDEMRNYFRTVWKCEHVDKIKDRKQYILFLPFEYVVWQASEISRRNLMLYKGLRALIEDEIEMERGYKIYCDELVRCWASDRYEAMASYCPFSVSIEVINIG